MTTQQPPHLISALEDLDAQLEHNEQEVLEVIEAPKRRQPGLLVEVWLEGAPEPFEVRITNRERISYEKTAARHKEWPKLADGARNFAMTYLLWAASRRAELTSATFDQWQELMVDYDTIEEVPGDPTQ